MAQNHTTSMHSRISVAPAGQMAPALAGFVICPIGVSFVGSPVVSQWAIYQMAYEQAKIAVSQQWWAQLQNGLQNWAQN